VNGNFCVYSDDPAIEKYKAGLLPFDATDCIDHDQIFFNDKSFNGTMKEITISTGSSYLSPRTYPSGNIDKPYLKKYTIGPEYYKYLKYLFSIDETAVEGPPLHEPVNVKGNVKNGYGLFTIFHVTTDTIP